VLRTARSARDVAAKNVVIKNWKSDYTLAKDQFVKTLRQASACAGRFR